MGVHIMLFAGLIDRDTFKDEILAIARLHWADLEDWIQDPILRTPAFYQFDTDVEIPRNLDGAAEGDLAVTLREMDAPHGKSAARHVNGKIYFGAAGEFLDIAVPAVLTWRDRSCTVHR